MSNNQSQVASLIAGLQRTDPRLYEALTLLNTNLGDIDRELHPTTRASSIASPITTGSILSPENFEIASTGSTIRFTWDAAPGAFQYEIRRGISWDTANFITRTSSLQADIDPLVYGDYTYLIKSLTLGSIYSTTFSTITFSVASILPVTIDARVIDNNVLLSWTTPDSVFTIRRYTVQRNGVDIGHLTGTFTTIFEIVPGTYTYSVIAIDMAGNVSPTSSIDVLVNTPPDYSLQDVRVSILDGTRVNTVLESGPKLLCSWVTESYEDHFRGRGYDTWQDKIDAGYPIFIEPGSTTGSYEERIDYGLTISNIIASITYNTNALTVAGVSVVVKIKVSSDDITYSAYTSGSTQFFSTFRYLKFKLEFTGVSDKALIELYNLTITLDVKRENDGGTIDALSTDVSGTEVLFNKAFKDVESITTTAQDTTDGFTAIYDFTDIPNPTSFFVYVFDNAGSRVSKTVGWTARGII